MKYLLDTNICIYIIKKQSKPLLKRIESEDAFNIGISSVSVAEMQYGIVKSKYPEKNELALLEFLASFEIVPFGSMDTQVYGTTRAYLEAKGTPIGPYDLQIASQCVAREVILVTNNTGEFSRVPGLSLENWFK